MFHELFRRVIYNYERNVLELNIPFRLKFDSSQTWKNKIRTIQILLYV
jgi:hypothetical protein